jgi:DNA-binding MarR family transcriptional regulator
VRGLDAAQFEQRSDERVREAVGDDVDPDTFKASFDLIRLSTRLVQHLESTVHHPAGWSMGGFRVMFCVWVAGELEPRDIARLSGLSRAAVSSLLNTLERDGLVERHRESEDRRLVTVRLTAAGERGVADAYRRQHLEERQFFATVEQRQLRQLGSTLRFLLHRKSSSS